MVGFVLLTIALASAVQAQDSEIVAPDNKTQCVSQMVQWCNGMQYPQQGVGMNMLSIMVEDPKGSYRVFCASDNDGTNCTKNAMPWFSCTPDHTLTYKGKPLTTNSTDVDDEICNTADSAFNDLFVQNLSYNTTSMKREFETGMESFFEQMAAMQEEIEQIQQMLMKFPAVFFTPDFWVGSGGASGEVPDSTTVLPSTPSPTTDSSNHIEQE